MKLFKPDIPSRRRALLSSLVGKRLSRLVRYSRLPGQEAVTEYCLERTKVFGWTAGPIALEFESGLVIGAGGQPSENSVVVWVEPDDQRKTAVLPLAGDSELYPISGDDAEFADPRWKALCGACVIAIVVFRRVGQSVTHDDLPSEAAVRFDLDNRRSFFLSHGLHDDSDDFSVLLPDEVLPEIEPQLHAFLRLDQPAS